MSTNTSPRNYFTHPLEEELEKQKILIQTLTDERDFYKNFFENSESMVLSTKSKEKINTNFEKEEENENLFEQIDFKSEEGIQFQNFYEREMNDKYSILLYEKIQELKKLKKEILNSNELYKKNITEIVEYIKKSNNIEQEKDEEHENLIKKTEREIKKKLNSNFRNFKKKRIKIPMQHYQQKHKSPFSSPLVQKLKNIKKKKSDDGPGVLSPKSGQQSENVSSNEGSSISDIHESNSILSPLNMDDQNISQSLNDSPESFLSPNIRKSGSFPILDATTMRRFEEENPVKSRTKNSFQIELINDSIGGSEDPQEILLNSIKEDNLEVFEKLLNQSNDEHEFLKRRYLSENYTLLHYSVLHNSTKITDFILKKDEININSKDKQMRTPLHIASNIGSSISLVLISEGASTNIRDAYGNSPLILCLKQHHFSLCSQLILFGSDINFKKDNGMTALHESLSLGDEEMTRFIIEQENVKLNLKDSTNQTPLFKGCTKANVQFLYKFLNKPGIDYNAIDENGRNFFHILSLNKRYDFFNFMINKLDLDEVRRYTKLIISNDTLKGSTPIHLAVETTDTTTVQSLTLLFKRLNEDIAIHDFNDYTPCSYAHKLITTYQDKLIDNTNIYSIEDIEDKIKRLKSIHSFLLLNEVESSKSKSKRKGFGSFFKQ
eukprot:gene6007-10005_t